MVKKRLELGCPAFVVLILYGCSASLPFVAAKTLPGSYELKGSGQAAWLTLNPDGTYTEIIRHGGGATDNQSLLTLSGEVGLGTTGITAAEFATGVGEAKMRAGRSDVFRQSRWLRNGGYPLTPASYESAALPIGEQFLIIILGPPIMAALWWMASRGYGEAVQGGSVSERTKSRQRKGFWIILGLLYLVGFAIVLHAVFRRIS